MEYLPVPRDRAVQPIEVTFPSPEENWFDFYRDWRDYRAGKWWDSFPKRFGYTEDEYWDTSGLNAGKAWGNADFHAWILQRSRPELEAIAVSWLYFGTLSEVTCCFLDIPNYLKVADDGRFILSMTEKSMNAILERWISIQSHFGGLTCIRGVPEPIHAIMVDPQASPEETAHARARFNAPIVPFTRAKLDSKGRSLPFERAHRCLRRSKGILGLICERINLDTVFVIANLHEFLATALMEVVFIDEVVSRYDIRGEYSLGSWVGGRDFVHYTLKEVDRLGWCPRTISALEKDSARTLAVDHFETNLKSHQSSEDHSKCSRDMCVAYQLDPENYHNTHFPNEHHGEDCGHWDLDPDVSGAVLLSGPDSFPVLTFSLTGDGSNETLEVFDSASEPYYVAISHVWSHGFGNPKQNSLPACLLRRIQRSVNELPPPPGYQRSGDQPIPFWMDTLCCPLQPKEMRREAIMKMSATYRQASHVLVIDRNLWFLDSSRLSRLEIMMRIYRTTWMTRLWTLQEARFAAHLWFQFEDKAVNLEVFNKDFMNSQLTRDKSYGFAGFVSDSLFAQALSAHRRALREQSHVYVPGLTDVDDSNNLERLVTLNYSLNSRSTSWAGDEAICIANLMGLDLAPILDHPTKEPSLRMAAMWKQWSTFPSSIIFNRAPRLLEKGYRWAQSTFVRTAKSNIAFTGISDAATVGDQGGLILSMKGYLLRSRLPIAAAEAPVGAQSIPENERSGKGGTRKTFLLYEEVEDDKHIWFDVAVEDPVHEKMPAFDRDGEFAILFDDQTNVQNIDQRAKLALLAAVTQKDGTMIHVTSLYHLEIARAEPAAERSFNRALLCQDMWSKTEGKMELEPRMAAATILVAELLDDPEVRAYFRTTMLRNRTPDTAAWFNASPARRNDWDFRCSAGDIFIFKEMMISWLILACSATPIPKATSKWCVD